MRFFTLALAALPATLAAVIPDTTSNPTNVITAKDNASCKSCDDLYMICMQTCHDQSAPWQPGWYSVCNDYCFCQVSKHKGCPECGFEHPVCRVALSPDVEKEIEGAMKVAEMDADAGAGVVERDEVDGGGLDVVGALDVVETTSPNLKVAVVSELDPCTQCVDKNNWCLDDCNRPALGGISMNCFIACMCNDPSGGLSCPLSCINNLTCP